MTKTGKVQIYNFHKEQTYKVQRINIHSDCAPNREWQTMAKGLTEREADHYHKCMKHSDNCVWRVSPECN